MRAIVEEAVKERPAKSHASVAQRRILAAERESISPDVRLLFDGAFAAWKATWYEGQLAISSDPRSRAIGQYYKFLLALGPPIIPLVVEQLADPENFLALQLYDAIQPNPHLLVRYEPGDERIPEGEQGRARRVVQAWFANR